jgi:hypothetical protein
VKRIQLFTLALGLAGMGSVFADPAPSEEVQINFVNHGGIWNWDVVDSTTVLIQDRSRRWYKAKLRVSCIDLPFEQKIGFESNPDGSFDKFSAIRTRQQYCPLASLVRTDAPVKSSKKAAAPAAAAKAAPAPAAAPPSADAADLGH